MFRVYDNGKPAKYPGGLDIWANNEFDTLQEAIAYAKRWLGPYHYNGLKFKLNEKEDYSGCGDYIEIRG